jgi:hypothetical protein
MRPPRELRTHLGVLACGALSALTTGHGAPRRAPPEIRYHFVIDVQIDPEDKPPVGVKRRDLTAGLVAKLKLTPQLRNDVEFLPMGKDDKLPCAAASVCDVVTITESINALADPAGVAFVVTIRSTNRRHRDVIIPEPDARLNCEEPQQRPTSWFTCPGGYAETVATDLMAHLDAAHTAAGGGT